MFYFVMGQTGNMLELPINNWKNDCKKVTKNIPKFITPSIYRVNCKRRLSDQTNLNNPTCKRWYLRMRNFVVELTGASSSLDYLDRHRNDCKQFSNNNSRGLNYGLASSHNVAFLKRQKVRIRVYTARHVCESQLKFFCFLYKYLFFVGSER